MERLLTQIFHKNVEGKIEKGSIMGGRKKDLNEQRKNQI